MLTFHPSRVLRGVIAAIQKFAYPVLAAGAVLLVVGVTEAQVVTVVHSFNSNGHSAFPQYVTPAQGRDAKLYGTTQGTTLDLGSIFRLATTGATSDLYSLDGTQGIFPYAGLTLATDGSFYGTTSFGGSGNNGVLFKITPAGVYTVLHNFAGGNDGSDPQAAPIQASDGNLYGTTSGTVYQYTPAGAFITIYQFDGTHGQTVVGPVIQGSDGNLYGTAYQGGANNCGTIFKISKSGTLLFYYSFLCGVGGANPVAALVQASDGNFYGTTSAGGAGGFGTIFKMSRKGSVSILYSFRGNPSDGWAPGGLVEGTDGNLYGITTSGGQDNIGTLFKMTKSGNYSLLYSFVPAVGLSPLGTLMQHTNGQFYGTATQGGAGSAGSVYNLNMGLGSFITFVRPTGGVGQTAQILGQGLTGTTGLTFNGTAATSVNVLTDSYMTAVIPAGATTGAVVVTTPSGALTSNKSFKIIGGNTSAAKGKAGQRMTHAAKAK